MSNYRTVFKLKSKDACGKIVKGTSMYASKSTYYVEYRCLNCDIASTTSSYRTLQKAKSVLSGFMLNICENCRESSSEEDEDEEEEEEESVTLSCLSG